MQLFSLIDAEFAKMFLILLPPQSPPVSSTQHGQNRVPTEAAKGKYIWSPYMRAPVHPKALSMSFARASLSCDV